VILLVVRWYLRYGLSYSDLEELLAERGPMLSSRIPLSVIAFPLSGIAFSARREFA